MVRKFQFDDEIEEVIVETSDNNEINDLTHSLSNDQINDEEESSMAKKKKFVWKWWHYIIIAIGALGLAFAIYILVVSSNDGPVYGKTRCEGLEPIADTLLTQAESEVLKTYSTVETIDMSIECRQLKVDIIFKDDMNTKKAKEIAYSSIMILDDILNVKKSDQEFSYYFGTYNNIPQYEVNFYLNSKNSADFPIFGTKHVQNDDVSFTLSSVKDQDSKDKAQGTLND